MPPETANPEMPQLTDVLTRLAHHPRAAVAVGAFCLWISVSLIIYMWFIHRRESFLKKFVWLLVLLVPLLGWLFYAGCFRIPGPNSDGCPPSSIGVGGDGASI